jgi:hypothetical protein
MFSRSHADDKLCRKWKPFPVELLTGSDKTTQLRQFKITLNNSYETTGSNNVLQNHKKEVDSKGF